MQVVGEDGKPIDLEGQGGLKPLSHVVVSGIVGKRANEKTLVLNVTGIHVSRRPLREPVVSGSASVPRPDKQTPLAQGAKTVVLTVSGMT